MSTLEAALAYASRGVPVLPCHHKVPLTEHGCLDATTDATLIREWWSRWRMASVAIATGHGYDVLDVDGDAGFASLAALAERHGRFETASVITPRGGEHLWFCRPVGVSIGCSVGRVGVGLDVRGDGGYVIAPPSLGPNGRQYAWQSRCPIALMPDWLATLACRPERRPPEFPVPVRAAAPGKGSRYGLAALRAEADRVRRAAQGTRNHTLNRAAFALGQLVTGGELAVDIVVAELHAAAAAAGLEQHETTLTIRSGLSAGFALPRAARGSEAVCAA